MIMWQYQNDHLSHFSKKKKKWLDSVINQECFLHMIAKMVILVR